MINKKYLIIGGGITGLMMANCLNKNDFLLVEKDSSLGGYCRTIRRNGYIWDYAGHFFHFSKDEMKDFFKEEIKEREVVQCKKNTKIWYKDILIDYPFQKNIHQLPQNEFIDCLYDLYFKDEKTTYNSFLDMLYGKFGKSITEKFLKPYNEKLYACNLEQLDVNAMGRFFPNASLADIIKNMKTSNTISYNDVFFYPKDGAERFINALTKNLSGEKVWTNSELVSIDLDKKIAKIKKDTQYLSIKYDVLINSIPIHLLLQCTNRKDFNNLGKELQYNKVLVFNIGFDNGSENFSEYHWIYFPDKEINFYRVGFYNNILNMEKLSIYVEIGFSKDATVDIDTEFKKTIDNLRLVGIISEHKVIDYEAIIMDPAYVYINELQTMQIGKVKNLLGQSDVYSIGRYGAWKYCSMEDSMMDAIELYRELGN